MSFVFVELFVSSLIALLFEFQLAKLDSDLSLAL